jgi:hypothetical protein
VRAATGRRLKLHNHAWGRVMLGRSLGHVKPKSEPSVTDAFTEENGLPQSEALRFPLIRTSPNRKASLCARLAKCKEVLAAVH